MVIVYIFHSRLPSELLRIVAFIARILRCSSAFFFELSGLSQLLSCYNALVLGLDLVSVLGDFVALLRLGPEARNGEAVVEVGSEIKHDSNRKHDVRAELCVVLVSIIFAIGCLGRGQSGLTDVCCTEGLATHLEHFEIETTHFENLWL